MQLVVAEKPSVAKSIAHVIGATDRKDGYLEGNGYLVSWCVGHLVELAQPDVYSDEWKKWTYESLPMIPGVWQHEVKKDTVAQYKVLKQLMHEARVDAVTGRVDSKTEAEKIAGACLNGQALVMSVVKEEKAVAPPKPYDLTTLQRDANRLFGFTAKQTLEYTQRLYEKKLCTYPRTDSQFLSDDMEQTAKCVIEAIFDSIMLEKSVIFNPDIKRVLNSKKVTDHHAIIPTVEIAKSDLAALPETERKILSLIANRLVCATAERPLYENVKAEFVCGDYVFKASGKSVLKDGWKSFKKSFKHSFTIKEEKKLPELSEA